MAAVCLEEHHSCEARASLIRTKGWVSQWQLLPAHSDPYASECRLAPFASVVSGGDDSSTSHNRIPQQCSAPFKRQQRALRWAGGPAWYLPRMVSPVDQQADRVAEVDVEMACRSMRTWRLALGSLSKTAAPAEAHIARTLVTRTMQGSLKYPEELGNPR